MPPFISPPRISYEAAARAVDLAMQVGHAHGVLAVVAVADPSMQIIAYGLADGATPHSAETSIRKAKTSASTRKRTAHLPEALATALPLATGGILTTIDGGFPLRFDGLHIGALGIAGGTPAEDAAIAVEVLALLGADTVEELKST